MTGVDRVEHAYLRALLDQQDPLFGLLRSSVGYLLLDRTGCSLLNDALDQDQWAAPDWIGRLRKLPPGRAGAETMLRKASVARCLPHRLGPMLAKSLPAGTHYINVGHTNLTERMITALRQVPDLQIAVLIHDTIPLDFPEFQRPQIPDRFRGFLNRAATHADLLICISEHTRQSVSRHVPSMPATIVAHLGLGPLAPGPAPTGPWHEPYFVCLGTIEPRKNHQLLLDIWPEVPDAHLLICGARGWENNDVFARLDARPERVHELNDLPDAQIHGLLQGATGLLFPSLAEGFGLPPVEAAALGTPVLCNDLPVYREILGNIPVYASVTDGYAWVHEIKKMASANQDPAADSPPAFTAPDWATHFNKVLRHI